jgi:Polyketide cyclase / dehydrase and lipid transport
MSTRTLKHEGHVETVTAASPEAVWDVVSDVTRIGEWSHECKEAAWLDGATGAGPGARFQGRNRLQRMGWARQNELVVADAPRELVWRTVPTRRYADSTEWRIRLEPFAGGTRIVQTYEILHIHPLVDRLFWLLIPAHRDRMPALLEDIRRLGEVAARSGVGSVPRHTEYERLRTGDRA